MVIAEQRFYILKTFRHGERDTISWAVTEELGRISFLSKNSVQSRRFGGSLETLALSRGSLQGRPDDELWKLQGADLLHRFTCADLTGLSAAGALSEILTRTLPLHLPCQDVFKLFGNALLAIEENPNRPFLILNAFMIKLLIWSGYTPNLESEEYASDITSAVHDARLALATPIREAIRSAQADESAHRSLWDALFRFGCFHIAGLDRGPLASLKSLTSPHGAPDPTEPTQELGPAFPKKPRNRENNPTVQ